MSKQQYYEAHITMQGVPNAVKALLAPVADLIGWRFSAIDGDANLGDGLKCYLTKQMNTKLPVEAAQQALLFAATKVSEAGVPVLRRKIELVLWDDRISSVPCAAEECAACPSNAG